MTNPGPLVFRMDSALLLFVTDKYNVRPNVYATPGLGGRRRARHG